MTEHVERKWGFIGGLLLFVAGWMAVSVPMMGAPLQTAAAAAPANAVHERGDISGDWQGTMQQGNRSIRMVLRITKEEKSWGGKVFVFGDQGAQAFNVSAITLDGSTFKFSVTVIGGSYEGAMSADGTTVTGTL